MPDQPSRSPRQVYVADHLWDTFAVMSREMGVDRDSLINQALFLLARQNGYLAPGQGTARPAGERTPELSGRVSNTNNVAAPRFAPEGVTPPRGGPAPLPPIEEFPHADFDEGFGVSPPPASVSRADPAPVEPKVVSSRVSAAPPAPPADDIGAPEEEERSPAPAAAEGRALVLFAEGREVDRVSAARFLIGRGKHCDLIINSGKVSREHAAIIRDGDAFFIEDRGSSNGTWFDKKRITRRKIEDGDEYFVCSEKITCRFE